MNIKSALLSLTLLSSPAFAQEDMHLVDNNTQEGDSSAFLQVAAGQLKEQFCAAQYTIMGDTNHNAPEIHSFIGTDEIFDAMEECGIKHVFVESAKETQPIYDALIANDITVDEFLTRMKQAGYGTRGDDVLQASANVALEAGERGMTFYAAQMETGAAGITEIMLYTQFAFKLWEELLPEDMKEDFNNKIFNGQELSEERWRAILQVIIDNQDDPRFASAQTLFDRADAAEESMKANGIKRTDDTLLYNYVTERVAPDERAMIIVGDGHPSEPDIGIYDRLGAQNARWVSVYNDITGLNRDEGQKPNAVVDLQNRTVFKP